MGNVYKKLVKKSTPSLNKFIIRVFGSLALLLYFGIGNINAQTYTIGTGLNTTYLVPINSLYGYSYNQSIYPASLLTAQGMVAPKTITQISWYVNTANASTTNAGWTIYLGNTTQTSFVSTTNWIPSSGLTQVFVGTVIPSPAGWVTVTLTTPFVWNGSNLVVAVDENNAGYSYSSTMFRYTAGAANSSIMYYSDGTNPNPVSPPTASTRNTYLPNIQLNCPPPSCSGTPLAGTAAISSSVGCPSTNFNLSATGTTTLAGISHQWESGPSSVGPWTSLAGGTTLAYTTSTTTTTFYRLKSTCATGGLFAYSSVVSYSIATPAIPSGVAATPNPLCAGLTTSLSATSAGASIQWYTVPSGGTSLGSSLSGAYFSAIPTTTTTYYAQSFLLGSATTQSLSYTGGMQTYTVPSGVTSLTVDAAGGKGGTGSTGTGGNGGRIQTVIAVTPGQVLNVYVGGAGGNLNNVAGYNGGAIGAGPYPTSIGGGGGASDIRIGGVALSNRVVVAGGGGGGGYNGCTDNGGAGGGLIGAAGNIGCGTTAAGGGSQVAGGAGGVYGGSVGSPGTLGIGGAGATSTGGAGGGGGYYGGGGGAWQGGGGGSSFSTGTVTTHTQGFQAGNGYVYITAQGIGCVSAIRTPVTVNTNPSPTLTVNSGTLCAGSSYTIVPSGASSYTYSSGSAIVSPTTTTSYTVSGTASGCSSSVVCTVSVQVCCNAPSLVTATPNPLCAGKTVTLNATAVGASINWYTVPSGGTSLGTTLSGVNFSTVPTATTTYYAESFILGGAITQTLNYTGSIVTYTVPAGVTTLTITAKGASGGYRSGTTGGLGASMSGVFTVIPGQVLSVLVGQSPGLTTLFPGGGGGTFVGLGAAYASATPLIAAGGGGGSYSGAGTNAPITTSGTGPSPGTLGNGAPSSSCGSGGGGYYTNGGNDLNYGFIGGRGFWQGGAGGTASITYAASYQAGGFGGGGAADYVGSCNTMGGAGGGYSGGSAQGTGGISIGSAGGSFNGGASQVNTAGANTGNGQVLISTSSIGCVSAIRTPVTVNTNPSPTLTVNSGTLCTGSSYTIVPSGALSYTYSGGSAIVSPSVTTSYTVTGTNGTCTSSVVCTVSVQLCCNAPSLVTATPNPLCAGSTVTLNATAPGTSINWYTVPSGGTSLGTTLSGVNFSTVPTATTTYYAESFVLGGASTQSLSYTGGMQTYTVPSGVTSLTIDATGGKGGTGSTGTGGNGGRIQTVIAVTPGQVLNVYVGGAGGNLNNLAGYNGGAIGAGPYTTNVGGGGGASDIRIGGVALSNRVVVAGGGGGGGYNGCTENGGAGGGLIGASGTLGCGTTASGGGSQVAGGAGGFYSGYTAGSPGTLGLGGNGAAGNGGAGGGGGYYGGGGGAWQGGGGGSSFSTGTVTTHTQGFQAGNGYVYITSSAIGCVSAIRTPITVNTNPSPTLTVNSGTLCTGSSYTIVPSGASSYTYSSGTAIVSPSVTTSYTVTGTNGTCTSSVVCTVSVQVCCNAPSLVTATPNPLCAGSTVTLNATAVGTSINWYTVPSGGTSLGSSLSGVNFSTVPTATTTYYAESFILGGAITQTLSYTGGMQTYTVPSGVTSVTLEAYGAQGQTAGSSAGGLGGYTKATLTVTPGQVLNVYVGGQTGFNGGGLSGTMTSYTSGVGGGASDIRVGGVAFTNRVLVAGGGGGAGRNSCTSQSGGIGGYPGGFGGLGDGATGGNGGTSGGNVVGGSGCAVCCSFL
jgi:hypothetical protein